MKDVAELAVAAQAGDGEAYDALMGHFWQMAHATAYRYLGDYHLAQDLVQEAVIEAFVCLPRLREPAAFPGWFHQIVVRQCMRALRRTRAPSTSLDTGGLELLAEDTPEELTVRDEAWMCVRRAVAALPQHERLVVALFYGRRYSYHEVSVSLGIPITTVKKRLHSARRKLRVTLQAALGDEIALRSGEDAAVELIQLTRRWYGMIGRTNASGQEGAHPAAA